MHNMRSLRELGAENSYVWGFVGFGVVGTAVGFAIGLTVSESVLIGELSLFAGCLGGGIVGWLVGKWTGRIP